MNRYLLFADSATDPGLGWESFIGQFSTIEGARAAGKTLYNRQRVDWWQVVDLTTMEVVNDDADAVPNPA